jgi:hypothetical protein
MGKAGSRGFIVCDQEFDRAVLLINSVEQERYFVGGDVTYRHRIMVTMKLLLSSF